MSEVCYLSAWGINEMALFPVKNWRKYFNILRRAREIYFCFPLYTKNWVECSWVFTYISIDFHLPQVTIFYDVWLNLLLSISGYLNLGFSTPFLSLGASYMYPSLAAAKAAVIAVGEEIATFGLPSGISPLVFVFTGSGNGIAPMKILNWCFHDFSIIHLKKKSLGD